LIWASFYVHEGGHMLYGYIDGRITGHHNQFRISNWETMRIFGVPLPVPQQTRQVAGTLSVGFILGGPLLVVVVAGAACALSFAKTRRKAIWLVFAGFYLQELLGNVFCGTDHVWPGHLAACTTNPFLLHWDIPAQLMLAVGLFWALHPTIAPRARSCFRRWVLT
jgi:hypothetical protein